MVPIFGRSLLNLVFAVSPAGRLGFRRALVCWIALFAQISVPIAHAYHLTKEAKNDGCCDEDDCAPFRLQAERAVSGSSHKHEHHHHDESHCAVCQMFLAIRGHGLTSLPQPNLSLTFSCVTRVLALTDVWSAPFLGDPIARGPPPLA
jgi:hypothetical protein